MNKSVAELIAEIQALESGLGNKDFHFDIFPPAPPKLGIQLAKKSRGKGRRYKDWQR